MKKRKLLVDDLIEDKELDQKIVRSFYSKDSLSLDIFRKDGVSYVMHDSIRTKLLDVADSFIDFLGVNFFVYDVLLTGSLANYNWSEFSDVDLHILIDTSEFNDNAKNSVAIRDIMKEFFKSKKTIWNTSHQIKIKNYDVELYVQDINEKLVSSGVYSILTNKWLNEPTKRKQDIDEKQIMDKAGEYGELIDSLAMKAEEGEDVREEIVDVKNKLKKFRQSGLEKGGEYSYENLTFKLLRRNGYIEKLLNLKKSVTDKKLSVTQ